MDEDVVGASDVSLADLHAIATQLLADTPDGDSLPADCAALIALGVAASVTSLDREAIESAIDHALAAGASVAQAQEAVSLVSGLGVHSLMIGSVAVARRGRELGIFSDEPLDDERQKLWDRHIGEDPFWSGFEAEMPGFLDAMLRLSPDQFVAFFDYCAVPWKSGTIRARYKELIALASDATPTHRFVPGFRLHLKNALALGVGRRAVFEALAIAAAAPPHSGTR